MLSQPVSGVSFSEVETSSYRRQHCISQASGGDESPLLTLAICLTAMPLLNEFPEGRGRLGGILVYFMAVEHGELCSLRM